MTQVLHTLYKAFPQLGIRHIYHDLFKTDLITYTNLIPPSTFKTAHYFFPTPIQQQSIYSPPPPRVCCLPLYLIAVSHTSVILFSHTVVIQKGTYWLPVPDRSRGRPQPVGRPITKTHRDKITGLEQTTTGMHISIFPLRKPQYSALLSLHNILHFILKQWRN